jgi:hypothetical protein
LHAALCAIPTQHFNLKRSGFWKEALAAEDAKYQQYLALTNLDLDLLSKSARRLSFGGHALKQNRRGSFVRNGATGTNVATARRGSVALSATAANDLDLVRDLHQYQVTSLRLPPPQTAAAAAAEAQAALTQRKQSIASPPTKPTAASTARERQKSVTAIGITPPSASSTLGQTVTTRQRRLNSNPSDTFLSSTGGITSIVPTSYEVFEEANGEVINVDKLQQQLKEGGLRLSQAQRAMIVQQIEQGKSRAAMAAAQQRSSTSSSVSANVDKRQQVQGNHVGFNGRSGNTTSVSTRAGATAVVAVARLQDDDPTLFTAQQTGTHLTTAAASASASSPSSLQSKSKSGRFGKSQSTAVMDLTEVIDPWHPKFVADTNKVNGNPQRQLAAPEHSANEFFSKQGLVYVKSSSGVVVPLMADLPSPTV